MTDLFTSAPAIQPQRGFTTKPGVAAVRRTPGLAIGKAMNPEGVPQRSNAVNRRIVEPRWGSAHSGRLFLGCAVFTATPGFVVEPLSGFENHQIRPLCEVRAGFTRFEEDDVLFAKITPCMQNGKGAFARKLSNQHGFGSTEFHVLRATEIGDAEFIYHLAQSSEVRSKAVTFFTGSAGQQRVDSKFFSCFNLLIPPLPQQRKIARILTTLDNVIAQTEALIAKYQAIKQGLMHDLFTRGVDATGKLRPPQSEAPELYKQSELGWIPKEWEVVRLAEIAEVGRGKFTPRPRNDPKYYGGQYPFIQTGNIAASIGRYLSDHTQTLNDLGTTVSKRFPEGTIVVTIAANIADTALSPSL